MLLKFLLTFSLVVLTTVSVSSHAYAQTAKERLDNGEVLYFRGLNAETGRAQTFYIRKVNPADFDTDDFNYEFGTFFTEDGFTGVYLPIQRERAYVLIDTYKATFDGANLKLLYKVKNASNFTTFKAKLKINLETGKGTYFFDNGNGYPFMWMSHYTKIAVSEIDASSICTFQMSDRGLQAL